MQDYINSNEIAFRQLCNLRTAYEIITEFSPDEEERKLSKNKISIINKKIIELVNNYKY